MATLMMLAIALAPPSFNSANGSVACGGSWPMAVTPAVASGSFRLSHVATTVPALFVTVTVQG